MAHARETRGRALTYGHDWELLNTRGLLLEADGYQADTAANLEELLGFLSTGVSYTLVVLCHTIEEAEHREIASALMERHREVPIYKMTAFASPKEFLDEVARLTGMPVLMSKG